jgi:hypothetical protein
MPLLRAQGEEVSQEGDKPAPEISTKAYSKLDSNPAYLASTKVTLGRVG